MSDHTTMITMAPGSELFDTSDERFADAVENIEGDDSSPKETLPLPQKETSDLSQDKPIIVEHDSGIPSKDQTTNCPSVSEAEPAEEQQPAEIIHKNEGQQVSDHGQEPQSHLIETVASAVSVNDAEGVCDVGVQDIASSPAPQDLTTSLEERPTQSAKETSKSTETSDDEDDQTSKAGPSLHNTNATMPTSSTEAAIVSMNTTKEDQKLVPLTVYSQELPQHNVADLASDYTGEEIGPVIETSRLSVGSIDFDTTLHEDVDKQERSMEDATFSDDDESQVGADHQEGSEEGGFGDEFDDFGEAIEGEEFVDFEGFEEGSAVPEETSNSNPRPPSPPIAPQLSVPVWDFASFDDKTQAQQAMADVVNALFTSHAELSSPLELDKSSGTGMFLTERSESLWNQLVAPPPLQPPDWKRSRIRRLFLVSLGVPVDLDEILPASKQKKLVLPSTKSLPALPSVAENNNSVHTGTSNDTAPASTTRPSVIRAATTQSDRKKSANGPPEFDEAAARILCTTSDLVLEGMSETALRDHIERLQGFTATASELLTYWLKKRDGAMGDKETFETVIESLVGYARKTRAGR